MICSPLQPMWDLTIHLLRVPASSLTHHLLSGSNIICNSSSLPLAYILHVKCRCQPHGFRTCMLGRYFHTFISYASFPFTTELGSHRISLTTYHRKQNMCLSVKATVDLNIIQLVITYNCDEKLMYVQISSNPKHIKH